MAALLRVAVYLLAAVLAVVWVVAAVTVWLVELAIAKRQQAPKPSFTLPTSLSAPKVGRVGATFACLLLLLGLLGGSGDSGDPTRAPDADLAAERQDRGAGDRAAAEERGQARADQRRAKTRARARRLRRERAEERRLARAAVAAAEEQAAQEAAVAATAASSCDPGYTPCVPAYPPDVNCPDVAGPVTVIGSDPHELDADGDGSACE